MRRAVTPGTFDPLTNGHLELIERSARLFDEVIVAVAASEKKKPLFELSERVALVKEATAHLSNVVVAPVNGLLVDFARQNNVQILVKGLRATTDFEYEFAMTAANYKLDSSLETIFMMAAPNNMYLSSSLVREIAGFHGDVSGFVPKCVERALDAKFGFRNNALANYYSSAVFEYGFNSLCKMTVPENLEGMVVLDLGCRRGKGVYKFSDRVGQSGHVIGVDWVPAYIEDAVAHIPSALEKNNLVKSNMEFHIGYPEDLAACGIEDSTIDVVWLNSVHNLFYDQSRAFSECARVLKPGGLLMCETVYSDVSRSEEVVGEARKIGNVIQAAQSKNVFEQLLAQAGFEHPGYTEQRMVEPSLGFKDGHRVSVVSSSEAVCYTAAVATSRKLAEG